MILLLPLAFAATPIEDDFEDGAMPPWRVENGDWREAEGALSGSQTAAGPGTLTVANHKTLSETVSFVMHTTGEGIGGVVWAFSSDGEWCAIYAGHGDVWIGSDVSGEVQVVDGEDSGTDPELSFVVDRTTTRVWIDGVEAYNAPTDCLANGVDGDIGVTVIAGTGDVNILDFAFEEGGLDADNDGWSDDEDCAPDDPEISPGADEVFYDGVDQDCSGDGDFDADGDGVLVDDDCDDRDASVHPGAEDIWYDGEDSDCAGNDDFDADGDTHQVEGAGGDDCDDGDATTYPGALTDECDSLDHDCDGFIPAPGACEEAAGDSGDTADSANGNGDGGGDADCGCDSGSAGGVGLALMGLALVVRRRR
ncbi:hypothetical protein LBMAG42_29100 [Deltaproteobacteria bacterium]|nr:hypothetical protein LBMAG42_29100 [Deltaproteobacteria bacterium]